MSQNTAPHSGLDYILNGLMSRYKERVPDVSVIINAMIHEGIISDENEIENDHIAFRTMGVPQLGIQSFEKIFLHHGYEKKDYYFFPEKKLNAYWYAPPHPKYPRIFISELRVHDLSPEAQEIILTYTDEVKSDPVDALDLDDAASIDKFLHSSLWHTPILAYYLSLAVESEYASFVIYNRYYLNHFTISVHNLKKGYNTIEQFNDFLERNHLTLNNAGGKIKVSGDGALLQSSTVAEMIEATFAGEKKFEIAGSYVEFAERKILNNFAHLSGDEVSREHRREGFEANNADKIFESTYSGQTERKG